jgi:glyoxylase-like metal-dependent hydrolase (beta-lactamase superfamily II)/rhodanese-related sulfurtransferase
MLFRQLFDPDTSSSSYLLADETTREAVVIDPVREQVDRDVELIGELGLSLVGALETHVHADHVTGGGALRERLGCRLFVGSRSGVLTADVQLADGDLVRFGRHELEARSTPGHTDGCVSYVCLDEGVAFTGDALLIRGCGRTDFQQGDAATLYRSVREKILSLPDATRIYPAHDYRGRTVSTVSEEKRFNPRLGSSKSLGDFSRIMGALRLAYPKRIDEAIPANMASGVTAPEETVASTQAGDAWAPVERTTSGVPVVSPAWVAAHGRDLRIVDVREHIEFCGPLGHIESAELVPFAQLESSSARWNRDEPIVVVCAYGTRSGNAATFLEARGFESVASLHGGMTRWTQEDLPRVEVMGDRGAEDPALFQAMGI